MDNYHRIAIQMGMYPAGTMMGDVCWMLTYNVQNAMEEDIPIKYCDGAIHLQFVVTFNTTAPCSFTHTVCKLLLMLAHE